MRKLRRLPLEQLQPYLIAAATAVGSPEPLNLQALFGNAHPVELEVGHGKGQFIVTAASERPAVNFLGVEIVYKYHLYTADRCARRQLTNVRLACADIRDFLPQQIAPASLSAIHVYFPDPWWKTRHHKRRIFTATFAAHCAMALRPGGRLFVATDVADYAQLVRQTCDPITQLRQCVPPASATDSLQTNFLRKAVLQGRPIHQITYERLDTSSSPEPDPTL